MTSAPRGRGDLLNGRHDEIRLVDLHVMAPLFAATISYPFRDIVARSFRCSSSNALPSGPVWSEIPRVITTSGMSPRGNSLFRRSARKPAKLLGFDRVVVLGPVRHLSMCPRAHALGVGGNDAAFPLSAAIDS